MGGEELESVLFFRELPSIASCPITKHSRVTAVMSMDGQFSQASRLSYHLRNGAHRNIGIGSLID